VKSQKELLLVVVVVVIQAQEKAVQRSSMIRWHRQLCSSGKRAFQRRLRGGGGKPRPREKSLILKMTRTTAAV
jgi:hypothetical protein